MPGAFFHPNEDLLRYLFSGAFIWRCRLILPVSLRDVKSELRRNRGYAPDKNIVKAGRERVGRIVLRLSSQVEVAGVALTVVKARNLTTTV